jgi:hypothetical protein
MPRKPFVVNETVREKVRHLAGVGVRQDDIARIIGCAPKTLRKRCRDDLDAAAEFGLLAVPARPSRGDRIEPLLAIG